MPFIDSGTNDGLVSSGQEIMDRRVFTGSAAASATGQLRLAYFTARKTETITKVRTISAATIVTVPTLIRIGIYTVASNGDLTLAASIANDITLYTVANTRYTSNLSAALNVQAGVRYAIGILVVAATMPTLVALSGSAGMSGEYSDGIRVTGFVAAADLPATQTDAGLSNSLAYWYARLLP